MNVKLAPVTIFAPLGQELYFNKTHAFMEHRVYVWNGPHTSTAQWCGRGVLHV